VLKPGGQVGLSNWGPEFFAPVAAMQRDLFREFGLRPLLTNPITFKHDQMRGLMEAAGFVQVELVQDHVELWFEQPQEVWNWNAAMGPFPIMLEQQLTCEQRQEVERRYVEMLIPLQTPQGIACTFHPLYTSSPVTRHSLLAARGCCWSCWRRTVAGPCTPCSTRRCWLTCLPLRC
jgi:hypothetical protein